MIIVIIARNTGRERKNFTKAPDPSKFFPLRLSRSGKIPLKILGCGS